MSKLEAKITYGNKHSPDEIVIKLYSGGRQLKISIPSYGAELDKKQVKSLARTLNLFAEEMEDDG